MKCYITGMGAISPMGNSVDEMFGKYLEGYCPITQVEEFKNFAGLKSHVGSLVENLSIDDIDRRVRRTSSKMSLMSIIALNEALKQAGISPSILNESKSLICTGSTTGSPTEYYNGNQNFFELQSSRGQKSTSVFKCMSHTASTNLALFLNFTGSVISSNSACASGNQSIVLASQLIKAGLYDIAIVGGCEEAHKTTVSTFDSAFASSTQYNDEPLKSSRPFDRDRSGVVVSEGAGIIILESEKSVNLRGVKILAEVKGGSYSSSGEHIAQSHSGSIQKNIEDALLSAAITADDIDFVSAHATGTKQGDLAESWGIFNGLNKRRVPIHSLKGYTGHTFAASGALETAMLVKMIQGSLAIPCYNLDNVDPELAGLDFLQEYRNMNLNTVLNFNSGFGGINSSLIISK